jgi:copper chaperone CopZ
MPTKTFLVPAISCNHCVRTIQNELAEVDGVVSVQANAQARRVTVAWDDRTNWEAIKTKLVEIDYPPQEGALPQEG